MQSQLDLRDLLPGCWPLAVRLRAKLDALYFHLYGVTDRDDNPLRLLYLSHR